MSSSKTISLFLFAGIFFNCNVSKKSLVAAQKPNIIFLLADDMRFDALGCNGNKIAITPHLDALAAKGTNFKNSYVTTAICAISRASFLTGQYEKRHGIDNFSKTFSDGAFQQTYPMLLRNNGYYTGFIGKYGVGDVMPVQAFDYWKGYPGQGTYFYKLPDGSMIHETALAGKQLQEFINGREKEKPFCLSISFKAPHSEDNSKENNGFRPDPYFDNWYVDTVFPKPVTYADSFYRLFPEAWRINQSQKENEARVRFNKRFGTDEQFQISYKSIYRLVSGVDKTIGEMLLYLEQQGLDKNTIIVFSSDNGYYMGEHGLEGKWYGHDESIRVPLIVYNPYLKEQRKQIEEPVLNIDLAPTILQWAGIKAPTSIQGRSYASLLTSKNMEWRKEFFYEHLFNPGSYPVYIPHTAGVVTASFKYMRYYTGTESDKFLYEELFDTKNDRDETKNLSSLLQYQQVKERLKEKVRAYDKNLH